MGLELTAEIPCLRNRLKCRTANFTGTDKPSVCAQNVRAGSLQTEGHTRSDEKAD